MIADKRIVERDFSDTSTLEKQTDEMVRAGTEALPLQSLTPEEIAIVEGKG